MKSFLLLFSLLLSYTLKAGVPHGIDWHQGTLDKAFKIARSENRPLFLYWGAVWCPPCNHIKKKVFTSPEFQKEVKNFLAVYLDGDTERAQIWGEKLKASGYPTMLVMSPQGKELMRFPTSVDAKKYVELLKSSAKRNISIEELVKKDKPTKEEWAELAFYSWGQNSNIKDKRALYEDLYKRVPSDMPLEKAAIFLNYLGSLSKVAKDKLVSLDRAALGKEFTGLLKNPEISKRFSSELSYSGADYIDFLFEKIDQRIENHSALKKLMDSFSVSKELTVEERLFALAYEMNLSVENKELLPSFQKKLLAKVKDTDLDAKDSYTRQDAMSTAIWMLQKSKLLKEAKDYGQKELKKSVAPYYFMSYLSSIEKELGNTEMAIEWKKRAWESAVGGSTRFQWGTSYLTSLIEHNKKKGFSKNFKVIISELLKQPDAFSGRNKSRLQSLQKALAKLKDKTFNLRIKALILEECSKVKEGKSCHESFKGLKLI